MVHEIGYKMIRKFSVFTHVQHQLHDRKYFAYPPYVREMNIWFKIVEKVTVVAPFTEKNTIIGEKAYISSSLAVKQIPSFDFLSMERSFKAVLKLPAIAIKIYREMKQSDHLHLRCPGNVGLVGCICQIFFPGKPKTAKYAGNWDPEAKQPWTYNLQKWILSNTFFTKNMQVLVYGEWPGQSKNVKPFFTASFSQKEIRQVREKKFEEPFTFIFVGTLVPGKHPLKAIKLVQEINNLRTNGKNPESRSVRLEIYGDGPEREMLEEYCRNENLRKLVYFKGIRTLEELKEAYQRAHLVVLLSESEGWPKAIAEAMFFGCIPIASPVSCLPWMLNFGKRGILLKDTTNFQYFVANNSNRSGQSTLGRDSYYVRGDSRVDLPQTLKGRGNGKRDVERIIKLLENPKKMKGMSDSAKNWSQQYTLERFEEAIQKVLTQANQEKQ